VVGAGGRGAGGGAQGEGAQAGGGDNPLDALNAIFPNGLQELQDLLRYPGQRGGGRGGRGGGFGFGGQAPTVNSGDYLVTLKVGGKTYSQLLRVERMSGGDDSGSPFEEHDDDHDPKR
jgi:hypothetical protein